MFITKGPCADRASDPPGGAGVVRERCEAVALGAAAAVLFAATASRDLAAGDAGELLLAARTFGIPHPPGYPVWVWLAGMFGRAPAGPFAYRVALLSVLSAAIGLGLLYRLARRSGAVRAASAAAVLSLAVSPAFWSSAGSVEVYPLAFAMDAAAAWALVLYCQLGEPRRLALALAAVGLALVSHQSACVFLPVMAVALWPRFRADGKPWRAAAAGLCAGLVPLLWLPVRSALHPALDWGHDASLPRLVANLSRACYGSLAQNPFDVARLARELLYFGFFQAGEWGLGALVAAAFGFTLWLVRDRRHGSLALAAFLALPLGLSLLLRFEPDATHAYQVGQFLLPMSAVTALALAQGLTHLLRAPLRFLRAPAMALLAVWVVAGALAHYPMADQHDLTLARKFGEDLLRPLPSGATLFVEGDNETFALAYLQKVEGRRADVRVVHRRGYVFDDLYHLASLPRALWPRRQRAVEEAFVRGHHGPIYCTGEMALPEGFDCVPEGLVSHVVRSGAPGVLPPATAREPGSTSAHAQASAGAHAPASPASRAPELPSTLRRMRYADFVTRKIAAAYLEGQAREAACGGSLERLVLAYRRLSYVAYDSPEAHYDLSRVLLLAGDREGARGEYEAALLLAPYEPWLRAAGRKLGFEVS